MKHFKNLTNLFIFVSVLSFPTFSIAQNPSASFSTGPAVSFSQDDNNTTVASVSGQISVSGINMSDLSIVQGVFSEDVSTWVNSPDLEVNNIVISGSNLASSNGNFTGTVGEGCISCFPVGTTHYFVFRILNTSSGEPPFPILNSVLVSVTVPQNPVEEIAWPQGVIENPLAVSDLNSFIVGLLNALLKIGIPVLTIFLVYSGLRLVMARGNEKELEDAKKNLLWVIIGGVILLGSWTIVRILKGTFDEIDLALINSLISHIV
jgi:hypothetical protein